MVSDSPLNSPPAARIELWRAEHDEMSAAALSQFESWLSSEERARQLRYRRRQDQIRYAVGRGMLRQLLSNVCGIPECDWRFALGAFGRPEPDPRMLQQFATSAAAFELPCFNISHSHGVTIAALGFGIQKLGADVETYDRESHWSLARRYFAPAEAEVVEGAEQQAKGPLFLRFWTLKEAYVKAIGQGITLGLETFAFQLSEADPPSVEFADPSAQAPPEQWHFFELPLSAERVAIASQAAGRPSLVQHQFLA